MIETRSPRHLESARTLFLRIDEMESRWPRQLTETDRQTFAQLSTAVDDLISDVGLNDASSGERDDQARGYARLMKQWLKANGPGHDFAIRSHLMADNIIELTNRFPAQTIHDLSWAYVDPVEHGHDVQPLRPYYDAIVFVEVTSPTHPTPNGTAAGRTGARF